MADKISNSEMVNSEGNTLSAKAPEFTTLAVIYESTLALLEELFGKINTTTLPSEADQKLYRKSARDFWNVLARDVHLFKMP